MKLFRSKQIAQENTQVAAAPSFSREHLIRWKTVLGQVDQKLGNLLKSSETEFLAIGNKLQQYSRQARQISDIAHKSADYFSGDEVNGAMEELSDILERIQRYVEFGNSRTDERKDVLFRAFQEIVNLNEPLSDFKRLVKKLNILGVTTNIENSRLQNGQNTFHNLAESVNSLSQHISVKSTEIEARSKQIEVMGKKQFGEIQHLESARAVQASSSIQSIQSCLADVSSKQQFLREMIETVSIDISEISRRIGDVVHSIQFHDITRQMIEHVQTALRKQTAALDEILSRESASFQDLSRSDAHLLQLNDICALQAAQLKNAKDDIARAMETIRQSLDAIIRDVIDVSDEIGRMNSSADTGNKICMDNMKDNIDFVTSSIHTFVDSNVQLNQTLKSVFDVIQEMGGYADDIRIIGADIELTAINGLINAARLGDEGAALSVLADAIQKLSGESREKVTRISGILTEIVHLTKNIVTDKNIEESAESAIMMVVEIENDLSVLVGNLSAINEKVKQKLFEIQTISTGYTGDVSALADDLYGDRVYQTVLRETVAMLDSVAEEFRQLGFSEIGVSSEEELHVLSGNYTMQQERDVHQNIVNGMESSGMENRMACAEAQVTDADFGNNVELF